MTVGDEYVSGPLSEWARALASELGLDLDTLAAAGYELPGVLDVARDAAHGVARPAAPLTTFLVGYAAGSGVVPDVAEASRRATALAASWQPEL